MLYFEYFFIFKLKYLFKNNLHVFGGTLQTDEFCYMSNKILGVSAGHYTAYAKNPRTDVWYYYNDEITSRQKPQDEDFSNAYILFYSRQGTNLKPCNI